MVVHYGTTTNYRLGWASIAGLLIVAGVFDLISPILVIGSITGPIYWVSLSAFLFTRGFGLLNARRLTSSIISLIIEVVPAVNTLPAILAGTIAIIIFSRIEDRTGISMHKKGVANAGAIRKTLNRDGRRDPTQPLPEEPQMERLASLTSRANMRPLNVDGMRQPTA